MQALCIEIPQHACQHQQRHNTLAGCCIRKQAGAGCVWQLLQPGLNQPECAEQPRNHKCKQHHMHINRAGFVAQRQLCSARFTLYPAPVQPKDGQPDQHHGKLQGCGLGQRSASAGQQPAQQSDHRPSNSLQRNSADCVQIPASNHGRRMLAVTGACPLQAAD